MLLIFYLINFGLAFWVSFLLLRYAVIGLEFLFVGALESYALFFIWLLPVYYVLKFVYGIFTAIVNFFVDCFIFLFTRPKVSIYKNDEESIINDCELKVFKTSIKINENGMYLIKKKFWTNSIKEEWFLTSDNISDTCISSGGLFNIYGNLHISTAVSNINEKMSFGPKISFDSRFRKRDLYKVNQINNLIKENLATS